MKRNIITINKEKCTVCGVCIPNCPEGAIRIIDNKAYLVSDLFCDGLGACLGHCPEGAITIEQREAGDYSEREVMKNIITHGVNVIKAHLDHLRSNNQDEYVKEAVSFLIENNIEVPDENREEVKPCSCMGAKERTIHKIETGYNNESQASQLRQWPVQMHRLLQHISRTAMFFLLQIAWHIRWEISMQTGSGEKRLQ